MKSTKFLKPHSDEALPAEYSFEILLDPIRSKMFFEIVLRGQATAEELMDLTGKSRSTISHHLKKLVESGLLEVYMNPTGKTKYYRIMSEIAKLMYTFDKEKFAAGTKEEQSEFIIEFIQMFSAVNHIFANLYTDQLKIYEKYKPFDNIAVDEKEDVQFTLKNKRKMEMPYFTFFITGEKQAEFLNKKLREMMREFSKEFEAMPDIDAMFSKPKHIVNLQIFPYIDDRELNDKKERE